jgi:hypothetical protein
MVVPTTEGWTMQKKYVVRLTGAEREALTELLKRQRVAAQKVRRARILLKVDADGPFKVDDARVKLKSVYPKLQV